MGFIEGDHFDDVQCRDLLGRTRIGRIGLSIGAVPAVIPIRYELSDTGILVGCGVDQVAKAMENSVIALQSDGFDEDSQKRWTVLAIGPTHRIGALELRSHAPEQHATAWDVDAVRNAPHLFHLEPGVLSGRWF
jgi:hypothetical protein